MSRKKRKPHKFKKKKPFYRKKVFWLIVFFIVAFSSLIYFLFFSGFFELKKINIEGDFDKISEKEVSLFIERELQEDNFLFLPSKNIFLTNPSIIKEKLLGKFPQASEIKINRAFPDSLNVLIQERKESAFFCREEKCFFLDEEGIVFEFGQEQESLVKIRDKRTSTLPKLGEKIIESKKIDLILKINSELEQDLELEIEEFIFLPEKLIVSTKEGWDAYFNIENNIDWQIIKLKVLLSERADDFRRENLEYIELRFGNFANPKYRD